MKKFTEINIFDREKRLSFHNFYEIKVSLYIVLRALSIMHRVSLKAMLTVPLRFSPKNILYFNKIGSDTIFRIFKIKKLRIFRMFK